MTQTKRIRQIIKKVIDRDKHGRVRLDLDGKPMTKTGVIGYQPAQPREKKQWRDKFGEIHDIWLSPGQIINTYKYAKRKERKAKKISH